VKIDKSCFQIQLVPLQEGENFEPLQPEQLRKATVKIRNLKKTFKNGVTAVDDLSVTFVPGQVSALLGHNGAGKTTTISILTGMLNQTSGEGGTAVECSCNHSA
jgi:ABC-type uncharacterized transport system ATPase subunit